MLPKTINIGPLTLHLYGLIIAISIYCGYQLAKSRSRFHKIPQKLFDDPILIIPLILGIAGARLYHVFDYWSYYSQNPIDVFKISSGGLGIFGGLGGIFAGFWLIAKIKRLNFLSLLDLISPSLLLGQAIGRIGNWVNQEGFGRPSNLPWGVHISPENRPVQFITSTHFHPTFFYEAAIDLLFFFLLIYFSKPSTVNRQLLTNRPGRTFALYLIFYSIGRFAVEFFRIDTATVGTIKVAHMLSITTFALGIFLLIKSKKGDVPS